MSTTDTVAGEPDADAEWLENWLDLWSEDGMGIGAEDKARLRRMAARLRAVQPDVVPLDCVAVRKILLEYFHTECDCDCSGELDEVCSQAAYEITKVRAVQPAPPEDFAAWRERLYDWTCLIMNADTPEDEERKINQATGELLALIRPAPSGKPLFRCTCGAP